VSKRRLRRAVAAAFAALDWRALGACVFEDPRGRFTARQLTELVETGLVAASALAEHEPGTSLIVGGGVAEVPAALGETLAGRRVVLLTKRIVEARILRAALEAGARAAKARGPRVVVGDAATAPLPARVRHLWLVSVLDDPEEFPALSAFYYRRADPRTFSGRRFDRDRRRARRIAARLLDRLWRPALIAASDDAFPWIEEGARRRGLAIEAGAPAWRAPTTRDPVRLLRIR
jgi:hypothetical protein